MKVRSFNWPLWVGFVLTLGAFLSYYLIFVWFPLTRDFPWASLLLFALAGLLLFGGVRRGFSSDRSKPKRAKIVTSIVGILSVLVFAFFIFMIFIFGRWLPPSKGAPQVGQKAPDFTLADTSGKQVSLTELLSSAENGRPTKGVLLVFYRGYW